LETYFNDGKVIPTWGHSSPGECAKWAKRVNAKKLALFHYGFAAADADIDTFEEKAQTIRRFSSQNKFGRIEKYKNFFGTSA